MKYALLATIIIILFLLLILPPLYEESKNHAANQSNSTSGNNSTNTQIQGLETINSINKPATITPHMQTPADFKGPTGEPSIIGPSGPPPNY